MYKLYMQSKGGNYVTPIYCDTPEQALAAAAPHAKHTPQIMITNEMDQSVAEFKDGELIYPDNLKLRNSLKRITQLDLSSYETKSIRKLIREYNRLAIDHYSNPSLNPDIKNTQETKIRYAEAQINAAYAITGANPYEQGFKPSATIETEIVNLKESELEQ